jgi:hypothetical protein
VNRIDLLGLSAEDVKNIQQIIQNAIDRMNKNRERIENPFRNNWCKRYPFACPTGYDSDDIKDCGEQTKTVNIELENGKYDDNWSFYIDSAFAHMWGIAVSSNNDDPVIYYDPRANEISIGKPCPSCSGLFGGRYYDTHPDSNNPPTRPFPPSSGNQ